MWGAAALAEKSLRRSMPARVLGLQEWKSRKFQQVGQQNSQPAGESLPEAGESTSHQDVWTKRNTRQPTTEREGHLLSGSPCSMSNLIKGLNCAPQVIVLWRWFKNHFHTRQALDPQSTLQLLSPPLARRGRNAGGGNTIFL